MRLSTRTAAAGSSEGVPIDALRRLLTAWFAAAGVPTVDPARCADDPTMPEGVRMAAQFLGRLVDPAPPLDDGPEAAATMAAIASEAHLPGNRRRLEAAATRMETATDAGSAAEAMWSAFCPDAVGLRADWPGAVAAVRARRALSDVQPPTSAIAPDKILLTANVLLGPPHGTGAGLPPVEREAAHRARSEPQVAWYDHPIPLDAPQENHELVYGLQALDRAVAFEQERGVLHGAVPVVLSLSTTHNALEAIAHRHVARIVAALRLDHLVVYAFTEDLAQRLVVEALGPSLAVAGRSASGASKVFGVAGPYGRHYSFLKAVAAAWSVLIDDGTRATFKIDLDQVFPQEQLVAETGASAFEQLADPLWGGTASDAEGNPVSLDFIAGALVNQADAPRGLHVPDLVDPGPPTRPEHMIFFSALPQAVSTEAEMLPGARNEPVRQRVHVTGGTTGATVEGLRRRRPFCPGFWGRAEDQAYALSVWRSTDRCVSLHVPGLVMRHDTHTFAGAAIAEAAVDKLIGDHERILMFSAYGRLVEPDLIGIGRDLAPFTGSFMSTMPVTVAYLRLAVTTLSWAQEGRIEDAGRLFDDGVRRLDRARRFIAEGDFAAAVQADADGWRDFYDALDLLETGLDAGERWAIEARRAGRGVFESARIVPAQS